MLLVEGDPQSADVVARDFGENGVDVTVAGTLAEARMALHQSSQPVDIVILELHLPDGRGESLLPDLERCQRQPTAMIITAGLHDLQMNALQYRPILMSKPVGTPALLRIVRTVAAGYSLPTIRRFACGLKLSRRETQVLVGVTKGFSAKEVAAEMLCSEKTVYTHLAHISQKAGCRDYHELIARFIAFACQAIGHTPPEYAAFCDDMAGSSQ